MKLISTLFNKNNKISINSFSLNIILSILFMLAYNLSFVILMYKILNNLERIDIGFLISLPFFFFAVFYILFSLFTIKYIEKPLLIIIIIFSSITTYYGFFYNVIFDPEMFVNIFETNKGEANSYINLSIILWVIVTGLIPAFIVSKLNITHYNFKKEAIYKLASILVCAIVVITLFFTFSKDYLSIKKNNPTLQHHITPVYFIKSFFKYVKVNYLEPKTKYKTLGTDATIHTSNLPKKNLLVIAVGETARRHNHQYNNYNKPTTPYTMAKDIIAFQHVSSCGTATATSVPCMFSRLSRKEFRRNKAKSEDNLMDIINRTNANVLWVDNDAGCKGVCNKIKNIEVPTSKVNKHCDGMSCHDEVLVDYLEQETNKLDSKDSIIVLHLIGSHGPAYYERYPEEFKKFTPDCQRSDIQNCTNEELVNTYDNTILYTDYVISKLIDTLNTKKDKWNTGLIYLSDHGESLGENNLYFHGSPYFIAPNEQTKIPMVMWFSDEFYKNNKIDKSKLKEQALTQSYSHDNLFDSVLGLMHVSTNVYNNNLDLFNSVRAKG